MAQAIEDGFQQCPMQRSVLSLPDFRKAYNTVWREKLLLYMLDTGIPSTFIRWIRSLTSSSSRQGLPQGSVLAPLLFLFFINNLAFSLNDDADNVSILNTARKKEGAEFAAQSVINFVLIGSQKWKLNLNADESEVYPFLTWSNNNTWEPAFFIGTQKILVNVTTYLLGVILDKSLTFNGHLKKVTTSLP